MNSELTKNEFRSIITTLGTDIKNKIIYETYHNPENFIPLQEVEKSSENSPLFIKGILSKFLIKNDITVAIKRENQNKEENETLSKTMIQLISSGEIFKKIMALSYDFDEENYKAKKKRIFPFIKNKRRQNNINKLSLWFSKI